MYPAKPTDIAREQPLALTVQLPDLSIDTIIPYTLPSSNTGIDIFYVYPTIDLRLVPGNTLISSIDTNRAKYVYSRQVGIYAQYGRVFVPYYRQATLGTFILSSGVQQARYIDTAYRDIESAFIHYLNNYNSGNKIILIGHSQGAWHLTFLLRRLFDNNPNLHEKLVVAILGGIPFYTAKGKNTGGPLQNIKTCPSLDYGLQCGCVMPWRSWKYGSTVPQLLSNNLCYNSFLVTKGLLYSVYDTLIHQESTFDFGYNQYKPLTRYIDLSVIDSISYIGWDNMFAAQSVKQSYPGGSGLMIQNIQQPGDLRISPLTGTNYHEWDMQFIQGDLLHILPQLILNCNPTGILNELNPESVVDIYPNPSSDLVNIKTTEQKPLSIKIFNLRGILVKEYFTTTFSISDLSEGMYFIVINTENFSYKTKLIKH